MTHARTTTKSSKAPAGKTRENWSGEVTRTSHALDIEPHIFTSGDPRRIAISLKHSAEASRRRKSTPYQSAVSLLSFYINRVGKALPGKQLRVLTRAKSELRKVFGRA